MMSVVDIMSTLGNVQYTGEDHEFSFVETHFSKQKGQAISTN